MLKIPDPYLEREKELLQLNATLNSKCSTLSDEQTKSTTDVKVKPNKRSKSIKLNGAKCKTVKSISAQQQSIKLRMSYEKVDVKSFYDELSKSILRLDMNVNKPYTFECENSESCGSKQDVTKLKIDTISIKAEKDLMHGDINDDDNDTGTSTDPSTCTVTDVSVGIINKGGHLPNGNPIENFLNEFTLDPMKLNIHPSNAVGDVRNTDGIRCGNATENSTNNKFRDNGPNDIPNTFLRKNVSAEGLIKFLKAKVTILQQELDLSHKENIKHSENIAKSIDAQKKLEYQRDQSNNKCNNFKTQILKLEELKADMDIKLKEKDIIHTSLRHDLDETKTKLKTVTQSVGILENRLFKSQEDLEYLRKNFHSAKDAEKCIQLQLQQERQFFENQIKMMQKQRMDLIAAYKKQLLLIDNLKRQNTCLEHAKLLQIGEKEFAKILDGTGIDRK